MKSIKDLIKKDLEEDFTPRFQGLSKNYATGKPMGAPKPTSNMTPKTPKTGTTKTTTTSAPKPPAAPKAPSASGDKSVGKPAMPDGSGMEKTDMKDSTQDKYHIYQDGKKLTEDRDAVTLNQIKQKHGSVQAFESKGFRLISADKGKHRKSEAVFNEIMSAHVPQFLGNIKELAKSNPLVALGALPANALIKADTRHVIAGEHIPDDRGNPPEPKKLKGKKDEGSGGSASELGKDDMSMDSGIPANKEIKPMDRKEALKKLKKCGMMRKCGTMKEA